MIEGSGSIPLTNGSGFGSATPLPSVKLSPRRGPPPKWTPPPCGETLNLQSGGAPPPAAHGSAWSAPGAPAPWPQGFSSEFIWMRIRIQHFRLNTDPPLPDTIRIQGCNYDQKFKKNYGWKKKIKFFLNQKLQFTYPYASIKDVPSYKRIT